MAGQNAEPAYPKREQYFAMKFTRLMVKTCLCQELGVGAFALLTIIVTTEDAAYYRRPVTWFNEQLTAVLGMSRHQLQLSREKCVKAGWLVHIPGAKGRAAKYWVRIPAYAAGLDDAPTDEGIPSDFIAGIGAESGRNAGGIGDLSGQNPGLVPATFLPVPIPNPPPPSGESEWQAVAAEIQELGMDDLGPLQKATNDAVPLGEIRLIVQHFRDHREDNGWGVQALHFRLRQAFPGQAVDRGWPAPDAKARSRLESAEKTQQRQDAVATERQKRQRVDAEYEALEGSHGAILSAMGLDDQLRMAGEISSQLVNEIRRRGGATTRATRGPLLLRLKNRAA